MSGYEKSKSCVSRTGHADLSMPSQLLGLCCGNPATCNNEKLGRERSVLKFLVQERRCLTINNVWNPFKQSDGS